MTAHEFRYCRYLLQIVKDLHIERAAMSTILDGRRQPEEGKSERPWRAILEQLKDDAVFRSSVEANLAPYFQRLHDSLASEKTFATVVAERAPNATG